MADFETQMIESIGFSRSTYRITGEVQGLSLMSS